MSHNDQLSRCRGTSTLWFGQGTAGTGCPSSGSLISRTLTHCWACSRVPLATVVLFALCVSAFLGSSPYCLLFWGQFCSDTSGDRDTEAGRPLGCKQGQNNHSPVKPNTSKRELPPVCWSKVKSQSWLEASPEICINLKVIWLELESSILFFLH